jgi:hypothetical protein
MDVIPNHSRVMRAPYGTKELYMQKKKAFPKQNIHYTHHDSVLPPKEIVRLYEMHSRPDYSNSGMEVDSRRY